MPELGEIISLPELQAEFKENCPFKQEAKKGSKRRDEHIGDDDKDEAEGLQENNGGILGENLEGKKPGVGTEGLFPPDDFLYEQKANDSKRGERTLIHLQEYKNAKEGDFPFTVAAHHLIPGNASLYKTDVKLVNYMDDGGNVKSNAGKSYTIEGHIGYDVNGSHNGVWLPGNYAIKKANPKKKQPSTTPVKGKSWSALSNTHEPWQYQYVAGACKAGRGQFHDSHEEPYSATVRSNLAKIVTALSTHLDSPCPDCSGKKKVLPPPHRIKRRLYALSQTLRGFVQGPPQAWKAPWFTSQKWSEKIFEDGEIKEDFLKAYANARVTDPAEVVVDDED